MIPEIKLKSRIETKVNFKVIRNGKVVTEAETENLILNSFTKMTGTPTARLFVGTGTRTPARADVSLENAIAVSAGQTFTPSTTAEPINGKERSATKTVDFTFTLGAVVGNITEFGLGTGSTIGIQNLVTRGLIKGLDGNPTTITVTAEDQLVVTYTFKKTTLAKKTPFSITTQQGQTIAGNICFGMRNSVATFLALFGNWNFSHLYATSATASIIFDENTLDFTVAVSENISTNQVTAASVSPTYGDLYVRREANYSLTLTQCNLAGGIKYMFSNSAMSSSSIALILEFIPPLPKDSTKVMSFKLVWEEFFT